MPRAASGARSSACSKPRAGGWFPPTAWRWIDDTTLEFDLRQGVKFHNGDTFGPDDVVYTLNYVIDPTNRVVASPAVTAGSIKCNDRP